MAMGWIDRMGQAIRAQINSTIRENEDPEKVLEVALLEMEGELIAMRQSLAEAVATQKRTERQLQQQEKNAKIWHDRAKLALEHRNEEKARVALGHWQTYNSQMLPLQTILARQVGVIQNLKKELLTIERKYAEMRAQKSLYVARLRSASASQKAREILGDLSTNPVFDRLEAKVLERESSLELTRESDPLERQFMALEEQKQIEAELVRIQNLEG
jgi:phage shock protein A